MKKLTKNQMELLAEIKKGNVYEKSADKRSLNGLIKKNLVCLMPVLGTLDHKVFVSEEGLKYFPEDTKVEEKPKPCSLCKEKPSTGEVQSVEHPFDCSMLCASCTTSMIKLKKQDAQRRLLTLPEIENVSVEEKAEIKEEKTSNYPKARKVCLPTIYGDLYIFLKDETGNPIHKNFVILPTHKPDVAKYAIKNCYRNQDLPKPMLIEYSFHKLITSIFPTGRLNTSYFDLFDQMSKGVQIFGDDGLIKSDYYHWSERNGKPVDHDEIRKPKPNQQLLEAEKELEDLISEVKNTDFESPNFCPINLVSLTKALREQFKYVKVLKQPERSNILPLQKGQDAFGRFPFKVKVPGQTMFPVPSFSGETS